MRQYFILLLTFVLGFGVVESVFAAVKNTPKSEALMIELTGKDPSKIDETTLYSELVAAFRRNDEIGFKSRLQTFLSKFAASSYADNTLYLAGRMALDNKNYAEAIKYFQKVITQYPRSNKVVAARLAKGVAYRKMNLAPQAKYVFQELKKKYPGSPESFRAENELKLIK
ncbi:MAG: tetratricopeptide repeat protein [Bdellovibrionaceae bacterium]|nr:tetratricopeptide repeat protein [Pseudobdellovibrionaceae bacterium]